MTYTTISSHTGGVQSWPSDWGTTGTLGVYADRNFVADDGRSYQAGSGDNLNGDFITQVAITVVANVPLYSTIVLPKTDLATPANIVRYYGRHFDSHGAPRDYHFESFHMRTSLGDSATYLQWVVDNQQRYRPQLDTYPTTNEMNAAIQAAIAGQLVRTTGTAVMVDGTIAVANTNISGASLVSPFSLDAGVTGSLWAILNSGVGFTIQSSNEGDNGVVGYIIL